MVLPVLLGFLWLVSPAAVFLLGALFAGLSLACAQMIPWHPEAGNETVLSRPFAQPAE